MASAIDIANQRFNELRELEGSKSTLNERKNIMAQLKVIPVHV